MISKRTYITILLGLLLLVNTNANNIDSLLTILSQESDSTPYNTYSRLYFELKNSYPDSATEYVLQVIDYAKLENRQDQLIIFYNHLGNQYERTSELNKSVEAFKKSYKYALEINDKSKASMTMNNVGGMLSNHGDFDEAAIYLFKALKIAEEEDLKERIGSIYTNLGLLFLHQEQWDKALDYLYLSEAPHIEIKDYKGLALLYNNMGIAYYYKDMLDSVLVNFERSLNMYIELDDRLGQTRPIFNIGEVYFEKGNYKKAIEYYNRSLKIERELNYKEGIAVSLMHIGSFYATKGDYKKALDNQREGLLISKTIGQKREVKDAYLALSSTFNSMENADSAFKYYKLYSELKDSLFTLDRTKQIIELETVYKSEKNAREILKLEKEREQRKTIIVAMLALSILLFLIIIFSVIYFKVQKKALLEKAFSTEQRKSFKIVLEAEESERKRIADELHNSISPLISQTQSYIADLADSAENAKIKDIELFGKSLKILEEANKETKSISHDLMPETLIQHGLVEAAKELVIKLNNKNNNISFTFDSKNVNERCIDNVEITNYRVLEELINVIIKHSDANAIKIKLRKSKSLLILSVHDNGKDFKASNSNTTQGVTWKSIYSRIGLINGEVQIHSEPAGTRIDVLSPI